MKRLLLLLLLPAAANAQADPQPKDSASGPALQWTLGFDATSSPVYSIRKKDTSFVNQLALMPVFDLQHESGVGFRYSPSFIVTGPHQGLQLQQFSLYYERYGEKAWDLDFFYSRFLFEKNKYFPASPLNNEVYGMVSYTKTWLAPVVSAAYGFGKNTNASNAYDVSASAGVQHNFATETKTRSRSITPSLELNAGTSNDFSFLKNAKYISRSPKFINKRGQLKKAAAASATEATGFALRNVELGVYASFTVNHVEFVLTGSLFAPLKSSESFDGYGQFGLRHHF